MYSTSCLAVAMGRKGFRQYMGACRQVDDLREQRLL
jgi:hypothetical protein